MKRFVVRISEMDYERIRFEALLEKKSIRDILKERLFFKPFSESVHEAIGSLIEKKIHKILQEK